MRAAFWGFVVSVHPPTRPWENAVNVVIPAQQCLCWRVKCHQSRQILNFLTKIKWQENVLFIGVQKCWGVGVFNSAAAIINKPVQMFIFHSHKHPLQFVGWLWPFLPCRWSFLCFCSVALQTWDQVSLWLPSAARSPSRTPSPQESSARLSAGAESWAFVTLTWTTFRRTQSSTWESVISLSCHLFPVLRSLMQKWTLMCLLLVHSTATQEAPW